MNHFADRLAAAVQRKRTPTCVGLDPQYTHLPAEITEQQGLNDPTDRECVIDAVVEFCRRVLRVVAPLVPAVKINSAFFEQYYWEGTEAYYELTQEAKSKGLLVIGDIKRADVGHSAERYAQAHLGGGGFEDLAADMIPDAVTVNPYFGYDGVRPFIEVARKEGKGVFVLVQTSNESSSEVQGLKLADGGTLVENLAQRVNGWAGDHGLIGASGYSALGAVVSPTNVESTRRLRALMPHCWFLVPGFGAQGRTAEDLAPCFRPDGTGALITASRSVLYAYKDVKYLEMYASEWEKCVERACKDFVTAVNTATRR